MAIWRAYRQADGNIGVVYFNLVNGTQHRCGRVRAATTVNELVRWVVVEGRAAAWDLISFDTGASFLVMTSGARA